MIHVLVVLAKSIRIAVVKTNIIIKTKSYFKLNSSFYMKK